jgi:N-acetylglucosamine kinase-like BadF-type ATPase
VGVILGVDGGNSKTDVLVARTDGEPIAYLRGPGSNAHGPAGARGCVAVIDGIVERARLDGPAEHGAFFLCGADVPSDFAALTDELAARRWVREALVENDTFALLRAGTDAVDAVAVVCGAGINCVGRAAGERTVRYPALGWETGDWGGSEMLGREALFHAARAEDARGPETALVEIVTAHFGLSVAAVGEEIHFRRIASERLGELSPAVIAAAGDGDSVARELVGRVAEEVALLAWKALRDLGLLERDADVVLGGGMLTSGRGFLHDEVVARLRRSAPHAHPVVAADPPVLGAALAALDQAGAPATAAARLRAAVRDGLPIEDVLG